jgi:chromosome segregation ATPase
MIDPRMTDIHPYPPTMQELELRVIELNTEINRLTSELETITTDRNFWQGKAHEKQSMIDNLEEYVKDQYDYIDENISQSLVDIFGFNITKDYDVTITVTFSGVVTAPLNFDMDDLENHLNASLDASYYGDVEADFSEDRMEIDWSES